MLPDSFLQFVQLHHLFEPSDRLLLAFSGGIDSVVLAHLLHDGKYDWALAHVNFGLRGEESDNDQSFCNDMARQFGVPFHTIRKNTKNHARRNKLSVQMAARDLRYEWLEEIRKDHGFDYILTAHHLNDSLETSLLNFSRGTGLSGLRGMVARTGRVLRPLLSTTREAIEVYACLNEFTWREDSSNVSDKYRRNFLRHQVIPLLKTVNPSLEQSYFRTSRRLQALEEVLNDLVRDLQAKHFHHSDQDMYVDQQAFLPVNVAVAEKLMEPYGLTFSQLEDLLEGIRSGTESQRYLTATHRINLNRGEVIISPLQEEIAERVVAEQEEALHFEEGTLIFRNVLPSEKILRGKHQASVDRNKLRFPLKLRKWKQGDTFYPLGMEGKKKLSDFMIDEKIPLNLKDRVCVLESAGKIVWVVGHRIDNRFRVSDKTSGVLQIIWEKNDQSV